MTGGQFSAHPCGVFPHTFARKIISFPHTFARMVLPSRLLPPKEGNGRTPSSVAADGDRSGFL